MGNWLDDIEAFLEKEKAKGEELNKKFGMSELSPETKQLIEDIAMSSPAMGVTKAVGKLTKTAAQKILNKVNTAEKAVALKGAERGKYLEALDKVYGDQAKRAKQMGFNPETYYHGTKQKFENFIPSEGGSAGKGAYLTTNEPIAKSFAQDNGKIFKGKIKGRILDLSTNEQIGFENIENAAKELGIEKEYANKRFKSGNAFYDLMNAYESKYPEAFEGLRGSQRENAFSKEIEKKGFSGIKFSQNAVEDYATNVFNPESIRSHKAAFDPRFKDSPLLMAGALAAPMSTMQTEQPSQVESQTMPQSMQEMLNQKPDVTPIVDLGQQSVGTEFAPLDYISQMGSGISGADEAMKQRKFAELAQYGQDPTAAMQLAEGQLDVRPYSQQISVAPQPQAQPIPMSLENQPTQVTPQETQRAVAAIPEPPKEIQQIEKAGLKAAAQGYEQGAYQVGQQKGMMDELEAMNKQFQERQKANQEALAKAQLKVQEIESEAGKIQPQDFWANRSTGSRIAAAIAMGVGAYASAMTGGPNTAKQIIDGAVAQDLALQKEKYQRAKERGAIARNVYGDLVAKLGSEEAASAAIINNAYKMISTKLQIQESQAQNAERAMKIQSLKADIDATRAAAQAKQVELLAKQEALKGAGQAQQPVPQGVLSKEDEQTYIRDPEFFGFAPTKEEAVAFRKGLPEYRSVMRDLTELNNITNQPGRSLNPVTGEKVKAIKQRLVGALREEILGPGVITKEERELILSDILGDPTAILSLDASTKAKLKSLSDSMQFRKAEQAKILGLQTKMRPSEMSRVTIQYQGQAGPITKDVTPEQAEVYERNAKARNIPFKRLTP
jgi:hypothetical protein